MKLSKRQLRQIIRKTILETYEQKDYSWTDFKVMATTGDYEGCYDWMSDYCRERNIRPESSLVEHMIEYASDETVTGEELDREMSALTGHGVHIGDYAQSMDDSMAY